jgi:hypothetical protein
MEERKQPGYWVQVTKYPGTQGDAAGTQERKQWAKEEAPRKEIGSSY